MLIAAETPPMATVALTLDFGHQIFTHPHCAVAFYDRRGEGVGVSLRVIIEKPDRCIRVKLAYRDGFRRSQRIAR
jgi:hypothetical protein